MFKFIHAADLHIDSPLRGLSRYESAPGEAIRGASRRAFINLVELAIEEKVAFVLLSGDLYDGDWKDYSTGIFFSQQVGRLGQHGIMVYAVSGNHDAANKITKALVVPPNMTMLSAKKPETILVEHLNVAIHGQSFPSQHVEENLSRSYPSAVRGMFNIGLLHTSLDGREGHANYAPCSEGDLRSKGYQYWALGHIHKQEIVSEEPWIVFPGCIQGRHIRETGTKGCVLVTVEENSAISIEKHALDVFRWMLCRVDLENATDIKEVLGRTRQAITNLKKQAEGRPVAMRIQFEGTTQVADELVAFPEKFNQQIRAVGAEYAHDEIWIEKVELAIKGKLDLDTILAGNTAIGTMVKEIMELTEDSIDHLEMDKILTQLRQKVPADVFNIETGFDFEDPRNMANLLNEAKHMLIGRLLVTGGTK